MILGQVTGRARRAQNAVVTVARTLLAFSRPHTIVGTVLSVVALHLLAVAWAEDAAVDPAGLAVALVAALGANVYIVGLNQLTDLEIDRINKPHLPLAAGTLTVPQGRWVTGGAAAVSAAAGLLGGPLLLTAVLLGMAVGTAYSVPPVRLKRFHVPAAAAIVAVRGLVVNLLVFAHFHTTLTGEVALPDHVLALTGMVLGLSAVIAWFKDLPDVEGDRAHRIATLPIRLGPRRVLTIGLVVLTACYTAVIVGALAGLEGVDGPTLAVAHLLFLVAAWVAWRVVRLDDRASVTRFYLFIWGLFFAEYLAFPAAAALA